MSPSDDLSGIPTSLPADLVPTWNAVILGILSHASDSGENLAKVLAAAPGFALGHAVRGLACLLLGRAEMFATARDAYANALAGEAADLRETAFVRALGDWLEGRPTHAAARLQAVLATEPRDALAMKMVQAIQFVMGRPKAMRASVEAVLPAWGDDHPALGYLLGCHAFTLEETGDYARAERIGRKGVELAPRDAWGLHAVAHVLDMTGRARDGLTWLTGREASWAHCNNFRYHVWWHRALMHLDLGEFDAALAIYDHDVRADQTDDYRDISNGASMLARLEIEGVDVGNRWEELAALSAARVDDNCLAFADLHYLLSLCGGKRADAATRLIARMRRSRPEEGEAQRIMQRPGLQVAEGLQAFAAGEYPRAWVHLRAGHGDMQKIGGSHAQRDVFERIAIEAALRGGYLDGAETLLRERLALRGNCLDGYAAARFALIEAARAQAV